MPQIYTDGNPVNPVRNNSLVVDKNRFADNGHHGSEISNGVNLVKKDLCGK